MCRLTMRQLRRWVDEGKFPRPHMIGTVQRWFEDELLAWQAQVRADKLEKQKK